MNVIVTLIICIIVSLIFTQIAKKLNIPIVVALIVGGLVLGSPLVKELILEPNTDFILSFGDLSLIFLMFLAGLEISWSMLYKEKRDAVFVAVFGAFIPLLLGFSVFFALGFSIVTSLTIGICMSITAEATKARVLLELKKIKTKLGSLMMAAGIIDDILGMVLFTLISYWLSKTMAVKELIILLTAILAFFIGILVHKIAGRETKELLYLERGLSVFIIPFFFIAMGIHFSLQSLRLNYNILIIIILIAIIGKILGVLLTKPFTKLRLRQLYLVGWGMNSRGAVELAIAFTAFKVGLLNENLYSSLVVMALVTTLIFPFFLKSLVKREPDIME